MRNRTPLPFRPIIMFAIVALSALAATNTPAVVRHIASTPLEASSKTLLTTPELVSVGPVEVGSMLWISLVTAGLGALACFTWIGWILRSPAANLAAPPCKADRLLIVEGIAKAAGIAAIASGGFLLALAILHTNVVDRWTTANRTWELVRHISAMTIGIATALGAVFSPWLWYILRLIKRQIAQTNPSDDA